MSGGYMDYAYHRISEMADDYVEDKEIKELMNDLSELMHDLEWWKSGDYSKGQYEESLADFKKKWFGESRDERLLKYIEESLDEMKVDLRLLIGIDEVEESEMLICPECGLEVHRDFRNCPRCGAKIEDVN